MRHMFDGITPSSLPAGGGLYAGYVDGRWPWAARLTSFRGVRLVRIAAEPSTNDGVVGDGPPDNGTWPAWVQWTVRRRAAGVDPTMYTNASSWAAGKAAFAAAHVAEPHWWIAHYDGDPAIPAGAVAKQYASNDSYDTSSVADYWPGVDPAPHPTAPAGNLEEDMMLIIRVKNATPVYMLSGALFWHVQDEADLQAYINAGIKQVTVDAAEVAAIQAARKAA